MSGDTVRMPADVDREDRLLAGLTARQLAIVSGAVVVLAGLWALLRPLVPPFVLAGFTLPLGALAVALALGRRDGMSADRLALAWFGHLRSERRLVPAPDGVPSLPAGVSAPRLPAPLSFPVLGVTDEGVLDLGGAGQTVLCRASSLNFGLRTEAEQRALVATFGRWLNSLDVPVQILVRAERVDVGSAVAALGAAGRSLPHPALESAAVEHAAFLSDLAARRDVLRRTVLVVFRQLPGPAATDLLTRRVEDATTALAPAGIRLDALTSEEALAALGTAIDPERRPRPLGMSLSDSIVFGRQ